MCAQGAPARAVLVVEARGTPPRHAPQVQTLFYRAPEVLCCANLYGTEVDMWSLGCVWAEMRELSRLACDAPPLVW